MSMLSEVYKEHQKRQQTLARHSELRKKEASRAVDAAVEVATEVLDEQIADIYRNQTLIYQETMKLLEMVDRHRIQTQKWEGMVNRVNKSIKEMGDIQHFASVIEYDMRDVAVTLANVKHRKIKG